MTNLESREYCAERLFGLYCLEEYCVSYDDVQQLHSFWNQDTLKLCILPLLALLNTRNHCHSAEDAYLYPIVVYLKLEYTHPCCFCVLTEPYSNVWYYAMFCFPIFACTAEIASRLPLSYAFCGQSNSYTGIWIVWSLKSYSSVGCILCEFASLTCITHFVYGISESYFYRIFMFQSIL